MCVLEKYHEETHTLNVGSTCGSGGHDCRVHLDYHPSPSSSPQTSTASQNSISMKGLAFNPSALTIVKGANVTWTNDDTTTHTVTSDTGYLSPAT